MPTTRPPFTGVRKRRARFAVRVAMCLLVLGVAGAVIPGCPEGTPGATPAGITVTVSGTRVIDPKLPSAGTIPLWFTVGPDGETFTVSVGVYSGPTLVYQIQAPTSTLGGTSTAIAWDGRDGTGNAIDPGTYVIRVTQTGGSVGTATYDHGIQIVRLGIRSIEAIDTGTDTEHDMTYFKRGASRSNATYTVTSGPQVLCSKYAGDVSDVDNNNGTPRAMPTPNANVSSPEMNGGAVDTSVHNWPVAYVMGTTPRLSVTVGNGATSEQTQTFVASGYSSAAGYAIRLTGSDGATPITPSGNLDPGDAVTVNLPNALPSYITKATRTIQWRWEYYNAATTAWEAVPGAVTSDLAVYTLLAVPAFRSAGSAYHPWVKVADWVTGWAAAALYYGATAINTTTELIGLIDKSIFLDLGIQYERNFGMSMYSGGALGAQNITYQIGDFMDGFANGIEVNCLDCAATTTAFCNMMGVSAVQMMFLQGPYGLNYIEGIGWGWTTQIFIGGGHAFSWHQVSTIDNGASVIDDCLNVDDDADPSVADAPNAIRGWNINRTWADYEWRSKASGTINRSVDNKPFLTNN